MVCFALLVRYSKSYGLLQNRPTFFRTFDYFLLNKSANHLSNFRRHRGALSLDSDTVEKLNVYDDIIYNSKIHNKSFLQMKRIQKAEARKKVESLNVLKPVVLDYFVDSNDNNISKDPSDHLKEGNGNDTELIHMPLSIKVRSVDVPPIELSGHENEECKDSDVEDTELDNLISYELQGRNWMNDYEKYSDLDTNSGEFEEWRLDYGTANSSVPVSKVPCGGCGALLHCQDSSIPGYLPYEIFKQCNEKDLRSITCQRCHFMKNYNTALSVAVDQDVYPQILLKIQKEKALVLLMVDLTDFPCSIWPGILDVIGKKRPIFVVGNKVDLLWGDKKGWMERAKEMLKSSLPREMNIKHICLISAKTGFGVEELINKLHVTWGYKGDVYLIGCTNVGKSSLFNSLLQSDYCKVKAVDLVQRATIAPWPGTTINLLKFPILRPEGWRLYLRTKRLQLDQECLRAERALKREQMKTEKVKLREPPQLIGRIGRTFKAQVTHEEIDDDDSFSMPNRKQLRTVVIQGSGLNPNDPDLVNSKWLYDTPGVLHNDQFLDLLTTEELTLTLPKKVIQPRTFQMKPGWSLFIGGVARLDYVQGEKPAKFTVFSSHHLPVTICTIDNAESVYNELVGTDYMAVPKGKGIRLEKWPNLQQGEMVKVSGISGEGSSIDIVLSSAGWIAVTPFHKTFGKFLPWTPNSRGIHIRQPPLLPFAVSLRGKRINKSPAYTRTKPLKL